MDLIRALDPLVTQIPLTAPFYRLTDRFAIGALAYPVLRGRQRLASLRLGSSVTVAQVARYLEGARAPRALSAAFGTSAALDNLDEALAHFDKAGSRWLTGPRRVGHGTFLAPKSIARRMTWDRWISVLEGVGPSGRREAGILRTQAVRGGTTWVQYLSVESARQIGHLRPADRNMLLAALSKGMTMEGLSTEYRPWIGAFSGHLRSIPVGWLFQFEPTRRMTEVLDRLSSAGMHNVGHMTVLQDECWNFCRAADMATLMAMRSVFFEQARSEI